MMQHFQHQKNQPSISCAFIHQVQRLKWKVKMLDFVLQGSPNVISSRVLQVAPIGLAVQDNKG